MLKFSINSFVIYFFIFLWPFSSSFGQSKEIPWEQRHFPTAPRITAQEAMQLKMSGLKIILIDAPWGKEDFMEGHVCGAIPTRWDAKSLDRLISKIPKDYVILAY
jgi:hypothetical protein